MAEIYRHVDDDGDVFDLHKSRSEGMYYVAILPDGDETRVRVVDLHDADLRRLLAALQQHYAEPAFGGVVEPSPQAVEEATHESFTELRCDREQGPHPRHTWSHKGEPCEGHVCPGERLPASLTRQHDPGALMEEPDLHEQGEGDDRG